MLYYTFVRARMFTLFFFFNDTATTEIYTLSLHERSSDLSPFAGPPDKPRPCPAPRSVPACAGSPRSRSSPSAPPGAARTPRSEEHTSELQSRQYLVCRLLLEKKKITISLLPAISITHSLY